MSEEFQKIVLKASNAGTFKKFHRENNQIIKYLINNLIKFKQ